MNCVRKCPHYLRHGIVGEDGISVTFKEMCGLSLKKIDGQKSKLKPMECCSVPFKKGFDYTLCEVYHLIFKIKGERNEVMPTSDFQYSDALSGTSITEMELF